MQKKELCAFGREVNHRLVDINKSKNWLIDQVAAMTGLYFDRSYLHKIETGDLQNQKIIAAIEEILGIKYASET